MLLFYILYFFLFLFRYSARLVYLFPLPVAVEAVFVAIILSVPSITNLHPLTTLFHIAMMSMSLLMMLHVSQCSDVCWYLTLYYVHIINFENIVNVPKEHNNMCDKVGPSHILQGLHLLS